jgi:hypothetical protein
MADRDRDAAEDFEEIEEQKDDEAITREPLEQALMEEDASELGEHITDADAVRPRRDD